MKRATGSPLGVVFYGKGGVGKSTVTAHVAVALRRAGLRVLLVGCDPKQDSSARFRTELRVESLVDRLSARRSIGFDDLLARTEAGVDLLETGGPEPGTGCAGRGVTALCEMLERDRVRERGYDLIVFDVLGDLVCGGFVAPLRFGLASRVFMVSSEEVASLFVVNNVARMLAHSSSEASAGGLVFNLKRPDAALPTLERFALQLGVDVVGVLPREPLVLEAEARHQTVFEHAPDSESAARYACLADAVVAACERDRSPAPTPLDLDGFWAFVRDHRDLL